MFAKGFSRAVVLNVCLLDSFKESSESCEHVSQINSCITTRLWKQNQNPYFGPWLRTSLDQRISFLVALSVIFKWCRKGKSRAPSPQRTKHRASSSLRPWGWGSLSFHPSGTLSFGPRLSVCGTSAGQSVIQLVSGRVSWKTVQAYQIFSYLVLEGQLKSQ